MTRKEFLQKTAILGLGAPLMSTFLASCVEDLFDADFEPTFSGRVLIIGAGSAGLHAGMVLKRWGIDFQILEASERFGGRVMKTEALADFPIDLGAEWIHANPRILSQIAGPESGASEQIETIRYRPQSYYMWQDGELKKRDFIRHLYAEHKFKSTTWFDYLAQYVFPSVQDQLVYQQAVSAIDYTGDQVRVSTQGGEEYTADRVIVTVPLTQLHQNTIAFSPALPADKIEALGQVTMPDGLKVFLRFSEPFYPDITFDGQLSAFLGDAETGDKAFYNAAYGKATNDHVLALFAVGEPAREYVAQGSNDNILDFLLREIDTKFDGAGSRYYQAHAVQNWSAQPFIQGSYAHYTDYDAQAVLGRPLEGKVYFAGEAYSTSDQSTVHGAALSAFQAVETILRGN